MIFNIIGNFIFQLEFCILHTVHIKKDFKQLRKSRAQSRLKNIYLIAWYLQGNLSRFFSPFSSPEGSDYAETPQTHLEGISDQTACIQLFSFCFVHTISNLKTAFQIVPDLKLFVSNLSFWRGIKGMPFVLPVLLHTSMKLLSLTPRGHLQTVGKPGKC